MAGKDRSQHEAGRGRKVPNISRLSREELSLVEFQVALAFIEDESDRGAAIMGAAMVETALVAAIHSKLTNHEEKDALFHKHGAPFGTMAAKATAVYAFGLCSKQASIELAAIRAIRNQFSHALRYIDFEEPEIERECAKLERHLAGSVEGTKNHVSLPRRTYEIACSSLFTEIIKAADRHLDQEAAYRGQTRLKPQLPIDLEGSDAWYNPKK